MVARCWPLLTEQLLLGVVLAGAAVLAVLAQKSVGAVASFQQFPLLFRIENASVGASAYLADFFSPGGLSVFYPYPAAYSATRLLVAGLVVLGLGGAAVVCRRRYPEVPGGILWFALFLAPVIGLVQVGEQARADRYMYIPMIGLVWIVVRGFERGRPHLRPLFRHALLAIVAAALVVVGFSAYRQAAYWKNTFLLATHSIQKVGPAPTLVALLGATYLENGDPELALPLFKALAHQKRPNLRHVVAYARALHGVGRLREAIDVCQQVVASDARDYYAHAYLSVWLLEAGEKAQAAEHAEKMSACGPPYGHVPFAPQVAPAE